MGNLMTGRIAVQISSCIALSSYKSIIAIVHCESVKQGELNKQLHAKSEGLNRMPINSWELQSTTAQMMNGYILLTLRGAVINLCPLTSSQWGGFNTS